ncbi:MAG: hypothetical protein VR78_13315 [Hoeflea sp. BRH_c9]|nr:MAG: hypothetical protein VR78_13315 [Hoeflea sp. BRH_c9]
MVMTDRMHVRAGAIDGRMDVAFSKKRTFVLRHRIPREIEAEEVMRLDHAGRQSSGKPESVWRLRITNTDMAEGVEHVFGYQYAVGGNEFSQKRFRVR